MENIRSFALPILIGVLMIGVLILAGCETVDATGKEEGAAPLEDQGLSPAEMEAMDAQARAAGDRPGQLRSTAPQGLDAPGQRRVIYFEYDSDEVKAEYRPIIEAQAAYLANHPQTVITLEGHADERGTREYNLALGERRALAVRRQLTLLGGSDGQARTVSFGEERPARDGHDEEAYGQNRRVEIVY
ncbi:MAG: peptidoglycan-associated lipoprotein Pal [Beggiatoa sp.]|nr:peptidoglycan-associated lipoprotein Pal [Beggiatoa sp.]